MVNRILIVGHGSIGKRHLFIAREAFPNADIRVLRHKPFYETPELANGCLNSLEEALIFAPNVAVVATPAPFHLETAIVLGGIGCHLLIEKPLSVSPKGISDLIKIMNEKEIVIQVGYNLRFLDSLREFKKRMDSGTIGRVISVRCEVGQDLPSWRPGFDYRQGVSANRYLGGGVLLELSHEIDYLRWIFGEIEWVNAWVGKQSALEIDVEDTAHLIFGFTLDSPNSGPVGALSMDFYRKDTARFCTAIGEKGSVRWNGLTGIIEEYNHNRCAWGTIFSSPFQREDSYRAQWCSFLSSIQSSQPPFVTVRDGLAVLNVLEAVKESVESNGKQTFVKNNFNLVVV